MYYRRAYYTTEEIWLFTWRVMWAVRAEDEYERVGNLGPSYALDQSYFFQKYEKKNLEFFTRSWESDFGNLCLSLIETIGFPFFKKKDLIFKRKN